ncbi:MULTISPECIES: MdtA/MuxA family multidrug efflux RND transporter periplasmic adaptor subunit [Edwardsiella]|uniref:Multidrug resistance protein MdtA n=2 Tax=Edwardsiella anguillarum TaxID=1821960 RepID=A0A076LSB6_9GAMM|nr:MULTISPECIES: MdtA/MuxA family multidrug efflux RND transporter periplasmic adaptor subunit [Edwardsiella]AKM48408.1 multidrug transporter [Edwardsiella sp. EA181011]GAJ66356.1 putative RND efflux membrane fusion protein [Edwardsiella piscicida]AIJ09443.1 multidrug RND efflux transporter, membrane fusion protein MtdA [Edwardsiella anguillarum ET080813]AKR77246.1 MdtA/MuxA family multidrug efflux RND transporter periplasmic adaptor subunit [Edwardsiella sp. LADL05-105]KAB0590473.1 MdtA/MuxA 
MSVLSALSSRRAKLCGLLILILLLLLGAFAWQHIASAPSAGESPVRQRDARPGRGMAQSVPVQAAAVRRAAQDSYLNGLGTVTASNTVTVRSRVDGQLMKLHFTEGQQVKAGDLLAEIDPRPFQIQLQQAQGALARDTALLDNARRDLARYQRLAKDNLVSRQELDTQASLVAQTQASLVSDRANVDSAQLQLDYSRIRAPGDGRAGLRQVDEGNYISSADTNGLVVLTQTHPIDVLFTLPEGDIPRLQQALQRQGTLVAEAWDRSDRQRLATGHLLSLDNQIDTATGTLKIKARFDNQDDRLFPNQFVNLRLQVASQAPVLLVPAAAVQTGREGRFVWVVDAENRVHKRSLSVGARDGDALVVQQGVDAGDKVVTDGIDRLTEGGQVDIIAAQRHDAAADHGDTPQP